MPNVLLIHAPQKRLSQASLARNDIDGRFEFH